MKDIGSIMQKMVKAGIQKLMAVMKEFLKDIGLII